MEQTDKTMYEFIAEVRTSLGVIREQLTTLIKGREGDQKRIEALEVAFNSMERELVERDAKLVELISQKESYLKQWVLKALLTVTLLGSFVWIKESREAVVSILRALF